MSTRRPIIERIIEAMMDAPHGRMRFREVAEKVFPDTEYPKAWRYATGGGPPGCYMALSAALRRNDIPWYPDENNNPSRGADWVVLPEKWRKK